LGAATPALLYRESEGRTIAEVALELGVGAETFRKWVRQDEADRGRSDRPSACSSWTAAARGIGRRRRATSRQDSHHHTAMPDAVTRSRVGRSCSGDV
jgi:transposase-like protein